jgi:CheY-like chemotaxis protein
VEDNLADARLAQESLKDYKVLNELFVVRDGEKAIEFLCRQGEYKIAPRPDLILLDLNLPKKHGKEVLAFIKNSPSLRKIPVIVLTSSRAERDILESQVLHCNGYVNKPLDIGEFGEIVKAIEEFWLTIMKLPRPSQQIEETTA